jgi:transposase-like protein
MSNSSLTLAQVIRKHVEWMLTLYSPADAARILRIGRTTLYRWRKRWALPLRKREAKRVTQKKGR